MKNKILIISGPTASGKSSFALEIANLKESTIINADSIQLYKELPILSAQPSQEEIYSFDHKLYSVTNYHEQNSVISWLEMAKKEIDLSFSNQKLPIIVGGTGLYLSKMLDGINEIPQSNPEIRSLCLTIWQESGNLGLIKKLEELGDKNNIIHNLDKQRLMRRLEILIQTNKTMDFWQNTPNKQIFTKEEFIHVNLDPNRDRLYRNCNDRFDNMLGSGAIDEVRELLKITDNQTNFPCSKTIGFLEIRDYLMNNIEISTAIEIAKQKTRNYAKRQLTWFRNQFENKLSIETVSRETIQKILELL